MVERQLPVDGVYLRFKATEESGRQAWVRRSLFATALPWARCWLIELATAFKDRGEAGVFARQYHLTADVEFVTVHAEAADAA